MEEVKILLVEDSPEMQLQVTAALKDLGLIVCVSSPSEALKEINKFKYNILILDVNLPEDDGFVLLSKIRMKLEYQDTPVFFLTGRQNISDKIMGFTLGAEDYLVKPIDPIELKIRISAKIRRLKKETQNSAILKKGPFIADLERMKLTIMDEKSELPIDLTATEFKLFVLFLRMEDRILSRAQILDQIWPNVEVNDRTVDSHIYSLRKKLGVWGARIEAISRLGYRFMNLSHKAAS